MTEVTLVRCIGCHTPLGQEPATAAMVEHARTCPEHPLAAELSRNAGETAALRAQLDAVRQMHDSERAVVIAAVKRAEAAEAELAAIRDSATTGHGNLETVRAACSYLRLRLETAFRQVEAAEALAAERLEVLRAVVARIDALVFHRDEAGVVTVQEPADFATFTAMVEDFDRARALGRASGAK